MGQKVHPIAIRLQNNRTFDSGWYNDNFSTLLKKEFLIRKAISSFFNILSFTIPGISLGRILFQRGYKKTVITLFIHREDNTKESKNSIKLKKSGKSFRRKNFRLIFSKWDFKNPSYRNQPNNHSHFGKSILFSEQSNQNNLLLDKTNSSIYTWLQKGLVTAISKKKFPGLFTYNRPNYDWFLGNVLIHLKKNGENKDLEYNAFYELFSRMIYFNNLKNPRSLEKKIEMESKLLRLLRNKDYTIGNFFINEKKIFIENQKPDKLLVQLENSLSNLCNENVNIRPVFSSKTAFSASFLADKIVSIFERNQRKKRTPYKAIKKLLVKSPSKCLGFRVLCSGRLGGVEMAKTFSLKKGQTSLNVFSQKIDFCQAKALTKYGIIGIKVWISFK